MKTSPRLVFTLVAAGSMITSAYAGTTMNVFAASFPNGEPALSIIDLTTGALTPFGTVAYGGTVNDIAANPVTGQLYGLSGSTLFTINTTTSIGSVQTLSSTGMNGGMESLAFDSAGNLFIATQSSLYRYNLESNAAAAVGTGYGNALQLGATGQNIRFNGATLYLTNTDPDNNDTDLYSINTASGSASFVGSIVGHAALTLGNYGDHMYGSSTPAIGRLTYDLVDFGTTVTATMGDNPDFGTPGEPAQELLVNHTSVLSGSTSSTFPQNVNFSGVPEPTSCVLLFAGAGSLAFLRRRRQIQ